MVRHHDEAGTGGKHVGALGEEGGEGVELLVHFDAQGLEELCQHLVFLASRQTALHGGFQLGCRLDGLGVASHDDVGGDELGLLHFAVEA